MSEIDILKTTSSYEVYSATSPTQSAMLDWVYQCALHLLKRPIDDALSEFLNHIGIAACADRVWMIEYDHDLLRFRNTHEWCRQSVEPFIAELQQTPTTLIGWLHKYMKNQQAVMIRDVSSLPRTAHKLRVEFLRQGNKSVLSVPIFFDGKLRGLIGFDATSKHRHWSEVEVNALFQCTTLIAQARYAGIQSLKTVPTIHDTDSLVYISKRGVLRGVVPEKIIGVRSAGNYSEIWLNDGSMLLDSRALSVWISILPAKIFMRIHRTAFVNLLHLVDIDRSTTDKWSISLRSVEQVWPVSRAYRRPLRERMGI